MAYWGNSDPIWLKLSGPQRAAAMALMEAEVGNNGINTSDARNALGAIINRSQEEGQPIGGHVSRDIYQPIIEDAQRSRLQNIVNSPEFKELTQLAESRLSGETPDWVGGADHYLAPPGTMLDLYNKNPDKYHNWGPFKNSKGVPGKNWTGYNPETGQYDNVVLKDNSHHFLNLINPTESKSLPGATTGESSMPKTGGEGPMIEALLSSILGMGGGGPGAAAGASMGQMTPLGQVGGSPVAAGGDATGMLSSLFPSSGGGGGQPTGQQGMALAQNAMRSAAGGGQSSNALQRRPIDLSSLQALLARKPMLGYGPSGPGRMM